MDTETFLTPFVAPLPTKFGDGERGDLADIIVDRLLENHSSKEAAVKLEYIMDVLKQASKKVRADALMYVEAEEPLLGALIAVGKKPEWDYHEDAELEKMEADKKKVAADITARQKLLQTLKSEVADTVTGEIMKPATKTSEGRSIRITLPK